MSSALRHLPNLISLLRIVLVGPIVWSLLEQHYELAIGLFIVAGFSDALDGLLAKRFGWSTRLGGILDALADKILLVSTFVSLWILGVFPTWLVLWILARDVLIVVGSAIYNSKVESFNPEPSLISKFNTLLQIILAALGVVHLGISSVPEWLLTGLMWSVVLTVFFSGLGYVTEWTRRAKVGGIGNDNGS